MLHNRTLEITEIFYSIQGESTHSGRPCVFVRLSGCNLRCSYCDTRYAYEQSMKMRVEDITAHVESYRCPLVEITGGEPLIQRHTPLLIDRLLEKRFEVLMETNGSRDIDAVDRRCARIVDIKCPSSKESDSYDIQNTHRLTAVDQVKLVIGDRIDYEYARKMADLLPQKLPRNHILFSPVFGKIRPDTLAAWILEDGLPFRLQIQLHKIIWPNRTRGV